MGGRGAGLVACRLPVSMLLPLLVLLLVFCTSLYSAPSCKLHCKETFSGTELGRGAAYGCAQAIAQL